MSLNRNDNQTESSIGGLSVRVKYKHHPTMGFGRSLHSKQAVMRITLKFQGFFRTLAGVDQEILDVAEGTTIQGLTSLLAERFQDLPLEDERTYFFVNGQVSTHNQVLEEGDRVLIFQLLAGG